MRTVCDVCEEAAAILFCAADEAALCRSCDDKVHMCNKLASRHVRVGLGDPSEVQNCDICENRPAFFYCEVDGTSLCLQCDIVVHVGGKRKHQRYLLMRQRVEFPVGNLDEPGLLPKSQTEVIKDQNQSPKLTSTVEVVDTDDDDKMDNKLIDLNFRPQRYRKLSSANQGMNGLNGTNHELADMVPDELFKREPEK